MKRSKRIRIRIKGDTTEGMEFGVQPVRHPCTLTLLVQAVRHVSGSCRIYFCT